FTGVAEVYWFGRGIMAGKRGYQGIKAGAEAVQAVQAARSVSGLYRGITGMEYVASVGGRFPRVGAFARQAMVSPSLADDMARFETQSFAGTILRQNAGRPAGGAAGQAYRASAVGRGIEAARATSVGRGAASVNAAWRQRSGVMMAKKFNQQVMRLGITSNVESLVDNRQGHSLGSMTNVDDYVNQAFANPAVDWGMDLLFFPPNIFEKGTIKRTVQLGTSAVRTTGRAVSHVPGFGALNWVDISANQQLLLAFNSPMEAWVKQVAEGAAGADDAVAAGQKAAKDWRKAVNRVGLQQAMADYHTQGDVARLGEAMGWVTTMGAIDSSARTAGTFGEIPEKMMSYSDRTDYYRTIDKLKAQIEVLDPSDIDELIRVASGHGVGAASKDVSELVDTASLVRSSGVKKAAREEAFRDEMIETVEEAASRGSGLQDDHVRLYGWRDPDLPDEIRWSTNQVDTGLDNPYVMDVSLDEVAYLDTLTPKQAAAAVADDAQGVGDAFRRRWMVRGEGGIRSQLRLDQVSGHRQFVPDRIRGFQHLADGHNLKRRGFMAQIMNDVNPAMLEQYYFETLPSFGRFHTWEAGMDDLDRLIKAGQLDNARYAPAYSPSGRRISLFPTGYEEMKYTEHVDNMLMQIPRDVRTVGGINSSMFDPMIRNVDPTRARFSLASLDTPVKQDAVAFAFKAKQAVTNVKMIARLRKLHDLDRILAEASEGLAAAGKPLEEATSTSARQAQFREIAEAIAGTHKLGEKDADRVRRILSMADEYGIRIDEVERHAQGILSEVSADPRWAVDFNVASLTGRPGMTISSPVELAEAQIKELYRQMNFIASSVDDIPASLAASLQKRGYRVVHGVQFSHAGDVKKLIPEFEEAGRRHIRQATLQSFFGRKDPDIMRRLKSRQMADQLYSALRKELDKVG
ncbi:MAG: hypothetical protein DRP42_07300, partial [Tenericutes bacterium]